MIVTVDEDKVSVIERKYRHGQVRTVWPRRTFNLTFGINIPERLVKLNYEEHRNLFHVAYDNEDNIHRVKNTDDHAIVRWLTVNKENILHQSYQRMNPKEVYDPDTDTWDIPQAVKDELNRKAAQAWAVRDKLAGKRKVKAIYEMCVTMYLKGLATGLWTEDDFGPEPKAQLQSYLDGFAEFEAADNQ